MIRLGRAANLHGFLAEQALKRKPTGRRAAKLRDLVSKEGLTGEQALARLQTADVTQAWGRKRTGLSVDYAVEATKAAKQAMVGSRLGAAWAKLIEDKGSFARAWQAVWDHTREAPRKNRDYSRGWLCVQIQSRNPILNPAPNAHGDNFVNLGAIMPSLASAAHDVRFLQHRPLPEDAKIVELKVIRHRTQWWLVLTVANDVPKEFPATGLRCGIDPGQKTPCTLAGEEMEPGIDGIEFQPGRPLTKSLKKLRRLQRKLDRQRRANNPECFREDGTWIKGRRLQRISNGMRETEDRIAAEHARCADIRKDYWNKTTNNILSCYDTVYIGNWRDGSPQQKGKTKAERKKAFAKKGAKREKGQAAQQRTRERINRDNALGVFRQTLEEKAKRSTTAKSVEVVNEKNTTRTCCRCGALEGPTGIKGLGTRNWKCPRCEFHQHRDRGAAWNILQAGLRQAGGRPVTEGRVVPLVARGIRAGHGSASGIERTSASGQAVSSSCEALASAKRGVTERDSNIEIRGPCQQFRHGPQPLADGTVSSSKVMA
jgi:transposase